MPTKKEMIDDIDKKINVESVQKELSDKVAEISAPQPTIHRVNEGASTSSKLLIMFLI